MAEIAPLTSAHNHARQATIQYHDKHFPQAIEEHHQASTDFARAARSTSDGEALRVLKLLEEQHRRLADLVKLRDDPQEILATDSTRGASSEPSSTDVSTTSPPAEKAASGKGKTSATSLASTKIGSQVRDSSPSLARDIASRRGIPQPGRTQPSAAAQARARQNSPESRRRSGAASTTRIPPSIVDSQANLQALKKAKKVDDDEGFARFYSNLTTGTMSKLSTVLAYAGLPLTAEDSRPEQTTKQQSRRQTVSAGDSPDVKKIFSKAALDAIEEEHRQRGTFGSGFGPGESFYLVPGTTLYSKVGLKENQDAEDEEPEFVDAKEAPGPPSPTSARHPNQQRGSFGSPRTQEELELENSTLKQTLEQVLGRLTAFEAHAQDASMAAVTQSMASLRAEPVATPPPSDAAMYERIRQLESKIEQQTEDRQKVETQNAKLERMNRKWKARWDDIQTRAKERTKAKRESEAKTDDGDVGGGDGVIGD